MATVSPGMYLVGRWDESVPPAFVEVGADMVCVCQNDAIPSVRHAIDDLDNGVERAWYWKPMLVPDVMPMELSP